MRDQLDNYELMFFVKERLRGIELKIKQDVIDTKKLTQLMSKQWDMLKQNRNKVKISNLLSKKVLSQIADNDVRGEIIFDILLMINEILINFILEK